MATRLAYNPAICADEGGTGYNTIFIDVMHYHGNQISEGQKLNMEWASMIVDHSYGS